MKNVLRVAVLGVTVLAILGATIWGALAFSYLLPASTLLRNAAACTFAVLCVAAIAALILLPRRRWSAVSAFVVLFGFTMLIWSGAKPSNDRKWATEVAVLPYATIDGDQITVHNIRDFDYRSEDDFTPAYYDRTFDLNRLDRVDLIAVYWMGPAIAHVFVSFGFGDEHLPISIEVRKERGEPYSSLAGFFRQYELYYVVADERDVIRLRTNYRQPAEDVYLYRLTAPASNARRLFLDYMRAINELRERPRFYNTLTTNCTTLILSHAAVNPDHPPFSWKVLLSGYVPEYAYEVGRLDRSLPFRELKRRAHINGLAQSADSTVDFSELIRLGMP
jgi:hypothetical protein